MSNTETWTPEEMINPHDVDKQRLSFEHALRTHINAATKSLEEFDETMNQHDNHWYIRYDANDGGMWHVETYRYGDTVKAKAVELFAAVMAVKVTASTQQCNRTLRSQIGYDGAHPNV